MTDAILQGEFDAEHAEFVALARGLTDEQWASPSLCEGWSVRDTVVHVAWHIHREPKEAAGFLLRGALSGSARVTAQQIARDGARSTDSLLEWFASPGQCNKVYLGELMIHQQDVRRPLGLDRKIADDRLTRILDLCLTRSGSLSLIPGSRKPRVVSTLLQLTLTGRPGRGRRHADPVRQSS